jgi:hypothetical protein
MRFAEAGTFEVEIVEAIIAEPKFSKAEDAFDVALKVRDAEGHEDWWRGEISGEYGKGNASDKTQAQMTLRTLNNIGWEHGLRFDQIHLLIGTRTVVTIEEKNNYYNIKYLGSGGGNVPVALDSNAMAQRIARAAAFFPAAEDDETPAAPAARPKPAAPAMPKPKAPPPPRSAAPAGETPKKNPFLA